MKEIVFYGVSIIIMFFWGVIVGDFWISKIINKEYENGKKYTSYYCFLSQWLRLRQDGYSLAGYLLEQDIHRVAIYGIAELGQRLYDELVESGIKVEYIIDNNQNVFFYDYKIFSMKDELLPVDAIIITPILSYESIKNEMKTKNIACPIISLELLLFNARKARRE